MWFCHVKKLSTQLNLHPTRSFIHLEMKYEKASWYNCLAKINTQFIKSKIVLEHITYRKWPKDVWERLSWNFNIFFLGQTKNDEKLERLFVWARVWCFWNLKMLITFGIRWFFACYWHRHYPSDLKLKLVFLLCGCEWPLKRPLWTWSREKIPKQVKRL